MDKKKIKITYAPGAFADFDGTQEELDEFVQKIEEMLTDESFLTNFEDCNELTIGAVALDREEDLNTEESKDKKRLH